MCVRERESERACVCVRRGELSDGSDESTEEKHQSEADVNWSEEDASSDRTVRKEHREGRGGRGGGV